MLDYFSAGCHVSSFWMNPFFLMTLWVWVVLNRGLVLIWRSSFGLWFLLH